MAKKKEKSNPVHRQRIDHERKNVPHNIRAQVLHESGYKCSNPNFRMIITLDVHYMTPVSNAGKDTAENLLPLCGNCHDLHHRGEITERSIRAWKFLLLALNEAFDRRSIDILLALDSKDSITMSHDRESSLVCSGDGLIQLAGLIASGLLNAQEHHNGGYTGGTDYKYFYSLTEKGRLFVEGWKRGNQTDAIRHCSNVTGSCRPGLV
jgi:HNH endonuclease